MDTSSLASAKRLQRWSVLLSVLGAIAVNFLSTRFPSPTQSVGTISNTRFADVQIIPANYAFAIWGLIYIGLIAFSVYQLQPSQRYNTPLHRHSGWLIVASIAQCIWIYLFQGLQFAWSMLPMVVILLSLVALYLGLGIGRLPASRRERWLVEYPVSLYFGWITVATVVNGAIALFSVQWNGWGLSATVWTIVMMLVSTAIAARLLVERADSVYALVVVWALGAIAAKQAAIPGIVVTSLVGASALGLMVLGTRVRRR
jgi:hypothetical protein